jgi:hypothetical protein
MATQAFTTTGGQTWTVPAGVTSIQVECYGGGGGGGGNTAGFNLTRGGGGGGYAKVNSISVTAGATVYINVGTGGAVTVNGGNSWVNVSANSQPASTTIGAVATGGTRGIDYTVAGTGGSGTVSNTSFSGGNGG